MGQLAFNISQEYVMESCLACNFNFGLPKEFIDKIKNDHSSFYCPACTNSMYFPNKSDKEKLQESLKRKQEQLDWRESQLKREQERTQTLKRQVAAQKGAATKFKNRVSKGVCPCCNRHFSNLEKHMNNKHPDFTKTTIKNSS